MAKDPAFLFYPGDWLGGTMGLSFEEKGAYMDLLVYQFNNGGFTEKQVKAFLRNDDIWDSLKIKFILKDGLYQNKRLTEEKEKRAAYTESRRQSRLKSDEDNVRIYIVRNNVRSTYKIGSSVNPIRRYNELNNQVSPAIMDEEQGNRDLTLIWYSNPVPRKTEKYLHTRFKTKRLSGEWFSLSLEDIELIKLEFDGSTYEKRTENENENIISIKNNTLTISDGTWEAEKKQFLIAEQWQMKQISEFGLNKERMMELVNEFLRELDNKEDYKDMKELKRHWYHWYKLRKTQKPQTELSDYQKDLLAQREKFKTKTA